MEFGLHKNNGIISCRTGTLGNTICTWQYATEFVRTDPLVESLGLALGKSAQELDSVFTLAQTL